MNVLFHKNDDDAVEFALICEIDLCWFITPDPILHEMLQKSYIKKYLKNGLYWQLHFKKLYSWVRYLLLTVIVTKY